MPRAQVSSQLDLPWPSSGAADLLRGVHALRGPSSYVNVALNANLVNSTGKKPFETADLPNVLLAPSLPWCNPWYTLEDPISF